jgi:hypothetical protein
MRKLNSTVRWLCFLVCALVAPVPCGAIDLLVYTTNSSGPGSLRQAVNDNNALGGGNTIVFSNTVTRTITLSNELLIITNVTILGPGACNVPGNGYLLWVTNFAGANQSRRFYRGAIAP